MNDVTKSRTVIHRDHTLEYDGDTWGVGRGGPRGSGDESYMVYRVSDGRDIGTTFDSLNDVRSWVDQARDNGWPLIAYRTIAEARDHYRTDNAGIWEMVAAGNVKAYRPTDSEPWRIEDRY